MFRRVVVDLRGRGSTWARLSVVCVAGGCLCSAVSCCVPLAVSRPGFAWQGQHLGTSVCCLCRRRPFVFRRVVPCSACRLQGWICVAGAALGHVCLLSVSPAAVCVPPCRAVFRLLSPGLDLRGRDSTWARLSVVCVAGGRLCSAVSCRVPLAVSRAGFAWQGQHLGTSVCCRVVLCSACCLQAWICVAGAALGHVCLLFVSPAAVCVPPCRAVFRLPSPGLDLRGRGSMGTSVCCLCRRRPFVSRRVVLCSACCLQAWICVAGAALGHVCLLSVSPAAVCVPPCRAVFRLLSPGLDLRGRGSTWARLSVVCVAGGRLCSAVSCRVPLAVSRAGFAWQGQHLGTSVCCLCRRRPFVSRRVVLCSACCLQAWICVAGTALGHVCLLFVSPAAVCVPPCRAVFRLPSPGLDLRGRGSMGTSVCCLCRRRPFVSRRVVACSACGLQGWFQYILYHILPNKVYRKSHHPLSLFWRRQPFCRCTLRLFDCSQEVQC